MDDFRTSIFATILYYDAFNFPLTLAEVFKFLINPERLSLKTDSATDIRAGNVAYELDRMVKTEIIGHKNGFYFLPGKDELYERRIKRDKLANRKWKRFTRK